MIDGSWRLRRRSPKDVSRTIMGSNDCAADCKEVSIIHTVDVQSLAFELLFSSLYSL